MPPYAMALVEAGLGHHDAVFKWLDLAYDKRDVHLTFLTRMIPSGARFARMHGFVTSSNAATSRARREGAATPGNSRLLKNPA